MIYIILNSKNFLELRINFLYQSHEKNLYFYIDCNVNIFERTKCI